MPTFALQTFPLLSGNVTGHIVCLQGYVIQELKRLLELIASWGGYEQAIAKNEVIGAAEELEASAESAKAG